MKKGFQRFLSSVLATVMAVAGMTIGMTTSAGAATGDFTLGAEAFYDATTTAKSEPDHNPVTLTGLYTAEVTSGTKTFTPGTVGTYATVKGKTLTNTSSFTHEMLAGGTRQITVTPSYSGTATVYVYHDGTKDFKLNGTSVTPAATKWTVTGYTVSCGANESFTIDLATNIVFLGLDYVAGSVTTYNWSLDTTGLTNVDPTGLTLGNTTSTALSNTLSYVGTGFELKPEYENITSSTTGVTVTGTDVVVKPTDDWFNVIAPKTYVSVEPTVSGNTTVYNFVQSDATEKYLVSVSDTTKSSTTAYADFGGSGGTDNDCYVTLNTTGAKLCDDSTTAAAKLVIPYSASTGKVTISGTVTPTNNIGGKWKLVDFGCVAVATDANKMVTLTNDNQVAVADNVGVAVKDQAVTYTVTIDFSTKTASGTIVNGATSKEFTNIPFVDGTTDMGSIAFTTNNGNSITKGNDRGLLIPSVTIKPESTAPVSGIVKTATYSAPALYVDGNTYYVVSVISNADATNTANSSINQNTSASTVSSSDTVYTGVQIGGVTYSAKDFCDSAADNDYVFASVVNNDSGTDSATVVNSIQTSVTTVIGQ